MAESRKWRTTFSANELEVLARERKLKANHFFSASQFSKILTSEKKTNQKMVQIIAKVNSVSTCERLAAQK